jgi:hypothetical protein
VGQVAQREQRILRRHQLSSVHHSPNQNVVDRRGDAQAKSPMQGKARRDRFRRRIASEDLSVSGSARRRLWVQTNTANEVRHLQVVNRRCRELMEDHRMKRAANKKDREAFKGSHHNNELARLAQQNAASHRDSPKAGRENRKKERHPRGHNSCDAIVAATPEPKIPGSLVFDTNAAVAAITDRRQRATVRDRRYSRVKLSSYIDR